MNGKNKMRMIAVTLIAVITLFIFLTVCTLPNVYSGKRRGGKSLKNFFSSSFQRAAISSGYVKVSGTQLYIDDDNDSGFRRQLVIAGAGLRVDKRHKW